MTRLKERSALHRRSFARLLSLTLVGVDVAGLAHSSCERRRIKMIIGSRESLEPADHMIAIFTVGLRVVGFVEMATLVVASVSLRLNL